MLFVACNEGGDDGGKTPGGDTPGGSTPGGSTPGGNTPGGGPPPVEDDDEVDPELAAAWDAMISDLDAVRADESEVKEFAFALEIAEKGEGEAADERGLAGKDGEFLKLNGFDLGHVMMTVLDDWLGLYGTNIMGMVPVTADGFKSAGLVGAILLGFVGDYANEGDAYMFELDLLSVINFIVGDGTEEGTALVDIDAELAKLTRRRLRRERISSADWWKALPKQPASRESTSSTSRARSTSKERTRQVIPMRRTLWTSLLTSIPSSSSECSTW